MARQLSGIMLQMFDDLGLNAPWGSGEQYAHERSEELRKQQKREAAGERAREAQLEWTQNYTPLPRIERLEYITRFWRAKTWNEEITRYPYNIKLVSVVKVPQLKELLDDGKCYYPAKAIDHDITISERDGHAVLDFGKETDEVYAISKRLNWNLRDPNQPKEFLKPVEVSDEEREKGYNLILESINEFHKKVCISGHTPRRRLK